MKVVLIFLAVVAVTSALSIYDLAREEWTTFKIQHGKRYASKVEEQWRLKIYIHNKYQVAKHNLRFILGLETYQQGLNRFSDMLPEELARINNGFKRSDPRTLLKDPKLKVNTYMGPANVQLPDTVDWRDAGAVTPVKNQGNCGSCWAFSTTGSLEGQHFRKTGKLVSMSEQDLMDCSTDYGNYGCDGGLMTNSFKYLMDNDGIDSEEDYPYEGTNGHQCRYSNSSRVTAVKSLTVIPSGDEQALMEAVATVGPVSVAINVIMSFVKHEKGVYYDAACNSSLTALNHGVLVVGYGTEDGNDYWLVKNSWSEKWGDKGYIKMARNRDNNCGIATEACYPIV